jgi:hypothetical protein
MALLKQINNPKAPFAISLKYNAAILYFFDKQIKMGYVLLKIIALNSKAIMYFLVSKIVRHGLFANVFN